MAIPCPSPLCHFWESHLILLHLSSLEAGEANAQEKGTYSYDRLCKFKPLYQQIRDTCRAHFHPRQDVAIDERMVKSKARISRQYMSAKPTK